MRFAGNNKPAQIDQVKNGGALMCAAIYFLGVAMHAVRPRNT
jgi:hypothetical protein